MSITWSYNPAIATSSDKVRLLVGDTNAAAPLFDDGAIAFFLAESTNVYGAAALAADALAGRVADQVDKKVGGTGAEIKASARFEHYKQLAVRLREQAANAAGSLPIPYAGGLSYAEKAADATDPDRILPAFGVDDGL